MLIITSNRKNLFVVFGVVFLAFVFFANVENVIISVKSALIFCSSQLIPSIFIFMVISSFVLYSKVLEAIFCILPEWFFKVLGICRKHSAPVLLSLMCGFVSAPKILCENYSKNEMDDTDFSNAIILSSNAGIGFVVCCVGVKIWGHIEYGFFLVVVQFLTMLFLNRILLKRTNNAITPCTNEINKVSLISSFCRAVSSSALTVISMCSFVVVFMVLINVVGDFLKISANAEALSIITVFFEFCNGSFAILKLNNPYLCGFLTGFCIGFGGLCVHFQTFFVCDGYPVNKIRFFIFKLFHGLFCGGISMAYVVVSGIEPIKPSLLSLDISLSHQITVFLLAISLAFALINQVKKIFLKVY